MKKLIAILVALAMAAMLSITAFAEGEGDEPVNEPTVTSLADTTGSVTASKKAWIAQGLAYPENTTIHIAGNNKDGVANSVSALPIVQDVTIQTDGATDTDADGFVVKNNTINFTTVFNTTTKHPAGVYTYTVTEDTTGTAVKYNKDATGASTNGTYYVSVYVDNTGAIKYVTVGTALDNNGAATDKVKPNPGEDSEPQDGDDAESGLLFNNTYTKAADDTDDPNDDTTDKFSFVVTKTVSGTYGSTDLAFPFQVTITLPATAAADNITLANLTAKANGETVTISNAGVATFTLKSGQSFTVDGAPVGTTYTVVEQLATKAADDASYKKYTATSITSSNYLNNGVATANYSATNAADDDSKRGLDYTVANALVAESGSTTAYENQNTQDDTNTPTGILISNLPYIALALVAIGGLVAYVVVRRRQDDEA